jgi:rRNA maturation endonuclease Nob1
MPRKRPDINPASRKFDEDFLSKWYCTGCEESKPIRARGFCDRCYARWLRQNKKDKEKHNRDLVNKILKRKRN